MRRAVLHSLALLTAIAIGTTVHARDLLRYTPPAPFGRITVTSRADGALTQLTNGALLGDGDVLVHVHVREADGETVTLVDALDTGGQVLESFELIGTWPTPRIELRLTWTDSSGRSDEVAAFVMNPTATWLMEPGGACLHETHGSEIHETQGSEVAVLPGVAGPQLRLDSGSGGTLRLKSFYPLDGETELTPEETVGADQTVTCQYDTSAETLSVTAPSFSHDANGVLSGSSVTASCETADGVMVVGTMVCR